MCRGRCCRRGGGGCGCRCLGASSLGHSSSGRHSRGEGGDKCNSTIHAVCGTPSGIVLIIRPRRTIACLLSRSLHIPCISFDGRTLRRARLPYSSIHPIPVPANRQQSERAAGTHQIIGPRPPRVNPEGRLPNYGALPLKVSCFLNPHRVSTGICPKKRPNHLAIGLLFIKGQHAGRDPECVVSIPPARKEAASKRWCSQPGVLLPQRKVFRRPVTGHQSRKAASTEAAFLVHPASYGNG